jgi:ketosteroid isomerase-like protein
MKKSFTRLVLVLPLALLLCLAFSCQKKAEKTEVKETAPVINFEAEKAGVKAVIDQSMQFLKTKDVEGYSKIMAHDPDMVNFGTDAAERWVGWESLKESLDKQNKSIDFEDFSFRDLIIKVHNSGEVAWFSAILGWKGKAQGQPFSMEGIRYTGVLEKRAGNWVCVQFHISAPVAGQVVKY